MMSKLISGLSCVYTDNFYDIDVDTFWNTGTQKEMKIHRIHSYPAKFPAFILDKGLEFVSKKGLHPQTIADIFCGCGTVAYESKRRGIDFWGFDINPVATMIAQTKSNFYKTEKLEKYKYHILESFCGHPKTGNPYKVAPERLQYWFTQESYNALFWLRESIRNSVSSRSKYRLFFYCAFSNILKATSRWLTKSIKPQIDPAKPSVDALVCFVKHCNFMIKAFAEHSHDTSSKTKIETCNFLSQKIVRPSVDMIVTSPPYVTSYEYADLHQLSSLWLEYTDDYRNLRRGSIGSTYQAESVSSECNIATATGRSIITSLSERDKNQAKSVSRYFMDMQKVIEISMDMLTPNGCLMLVVGDTEYRGVHIENARHIVELVLQRGFNGVSIAKRKISSKILTPYRDRAGRFSACASSKKIYGYEYIIVGFNKT